MQRHREKQSTGPGQTDHKPMNGRKHQDWVRPQSSARPGHVAVSGSSEASAPTGTGSAHARPETHLHRRSFHRPWPAQEPLPPVGLRSEGRGTGSQKTLGTGSSLPCVWHGAGEAGKGQGGVKDGSKGVLPDSTEPRVREGGRTPRAGRGSPESTAPRVQRGARTPRTGFAQVIPTDQDWVHPRHYGQLGPDHGVRGGTYVPRVTHPHPWPPLTGCQQHLLSNGPQKCLSDKHPLGGKIIPLQPRR